jgi:hypothetical protein
MRRLLLASLVSSCLVAAPEIAAARVAFVGLEGLGLDRTMVEPIEQLLEQALSRFLRGNMLSPSQVTANLLDPRLERLRKCGGDLPCLVDLGGITDSEIVVYGTLTRLGDTFVVLLRAIDVQTGAESQRVRQTLSGAPDQLVETIRSAVAQLLDLKRYRGSLQISSSVATAAVQVDGTEIRLDPGKPIEVGVGQHSVTISASGYRVWTAMVDVGFGETARLDAQLVQIDAAVTHSEGPGILRKYWPYLLLGGGGLALGGSAAFGVLTYNEQQSYRKAFRLNEEPPKYFTDARRRGDRDALLTNVFLGVGAALLSAGVIGWWTRPATAPVEATP